MKNAFNYNPTNYTLPQMQPMKPVNQVPQMSSIKNTYAKNILDTLGDSIKAPSAYTTGTSIANQFSPYEMLGQDFIQNNYLPEYLQDTYNPQVRDMANNAAAGNLALLGNGKQQLNQSTGRLRRDFQDQAQNILDLFRGEASRNTGEDIQNYYKSQFNF